MQQNQTTQSNPGQVLGIIGLVLGILAAIVSFVPCFGIYAIFPGVIGIALSAISMTQSGKVNAPKGLAIAGLVCSIVGTGIAGYQWYVLNKAANEFSRSLDDYNKKTEEMQDKLKDNNSSSGYSSPSSDYNNYSSPDAGDYNQAVEDAKTQYNDAYDNAQQQYNDAVQDAQNQIDNMDMNP